MAMKPIRHPMIIVLIHRSSQQIIYKLTKGWSPNHTMTNSGFWIVFIGNVDHISSVVVVDVSVRLGEFKLVSEGGNQSFKGMSDNGEDERVPERQKYLGL